MIGYGLKECKACRVRFDCPVRKWCLLAKCQGEEKLVFDHTINMPIIDTSGKIANASSVVSDNCLLVVIKDKKKYLSPELKKEMILDGRFIEL